MLDFSKMDQPLSLQLFCNDACLLQEHQTAKNHETHCLEQWVIWCGHLAVNGGVHAMAN